MKELERGGIRPGDVRIMVALGTHRSMSEEEIVDKFGGTLTDSFPVLITSGGSRPVWSTSEKPRREHPSSSTVCERS